MQKIPPVTPTFNKVRNWVRESFNDNAAQMLHFDRTVYWLTQLRPDADEALLIAGIAHDIERAFRPAERDFEKTSKSFKGEEHLDYHQREGARLTADYLMKIGADEKLIARVKHLIVRHEVGGDDDQNLLMDADSISFVENNAQIFLRKITVFGPEKIKEKFDWMYHRISSEKARTLAKPFYEKMIHELEVAGKNI